ncbi:MAG: hypothetical protein PVH54_10210 [Gammaproteobacteria bacterium]|jgi:hypothetical protein
MRELIDMYASLSPPPDAAGGEQLTAAIQEVVALKGEQHDFLKSQRKIVRFRYHTGVEAGMKSGRFNQNPDVITPEVLRQSTGGTGNETSAE